MRARRRQKLPETAASAFLHVLPPGLAATMEQMGCVLQPRLRPMRLPGGAVAVRMVWRERKTGLTMVVNLRGVAPARVNDA